jgi:4-amino-4-deoxy-L-arabinose transferase-like glycosyltransferase
MHMKGVHTVLNTQDRLFVVGVSAAYIVVSMSLLLSWPLLSPDEAIFADTARHLLVNGHPSTTLVAGMESGSYWQPPVWFYCMAPVIGIFGYGILPLRILSMLVGVLALWATFLLARQLDLSSWASRVGLLLLAFNPNFVTYVKFARMDGLCVLLTLLGLVAYVSYCVKGKFMHLVGASLLFGVAILTHPLGVIGPATAGCHTLLGLRGVEKTRFRALLLVILPVVVAAAVWFLSAENHAEFWTQLRFQMERKSRPFPVPVLSFIERYRSLPLFGLLVPAGLLSAWRRVHRAPSSLPLLLALGATISTVAVAFTFETPYHVYCLPLLSIACAGFFESCRSYHSPVRRAAVVGMIAVLGNFALYFVFFNYEFHGALRQETDYGAFTARIAEEIPKGATVCIAGYPCAYWGMNGLDRGYRLIEEAFLSDSLGIDVSSRAGWFVLVNGLNPDENAPDILLQFETMKRFATRAGKTCLLKDFIGARKRFAYTARVFQLLPECTESALKQK